LALVGVSLFDPETALRSRRRETRRPRIKQIEGPISPRKGHGALSFPGDASEGIRGIPKVKGTRHWTQIKGTNLAP